MDALLTRCKHGTQNRVLQQCHPAAGQSHVEVSVWTKFCIVSILVKGGFCFPRDAWLLKEAIAK